MGIRWEFESETELVWSGILWWTNGHRPFRSQTEWFPRFSRGNIWWGIWWIFNPQEKTSTGDGKKWNARGCIYRSDVYIRFGITLLLQLTYTRINAGVLTKETDHLKIPVSWFLNKVVTVFNVYLCSVFLFGIWCTHQQCPIFEMDYFWCDIFSLFSSPIFYITSAIFHHFLWKRR